MEESGDERGWQQLSPRTETALLIDQCNIAFHCKKCEEDIFKNYFVNLPHNSDKYQLATPVELVLTFMLSFLDYFRIRLATLFKHSFHHVHRSSQQKASARYIDSSQLLLQHNLHNYRWEVVFQKMERF
jgi:hypothetical protein